MKQRLFFIFVGLLMIVQTSLAGEPFPQCLVSYEAYTIYFLNEDTEYVSYRVNPDDPNSKYKGKKIDYVYTNNDVTREGHEWGKPDWIGYAGGTESNLIREIVFEESFKSVKIKSLNWFFCNLYALRKITGMENLDLSEVTITNSMCSDCHNLSSIDITGLDMTKLTNVTGMFGNCVSLKTIYCNQSLNCDITRENKASFLFACMNLVGGSGQTYQGPDLNAERVDKMYYNYAKYANPFVGLFTFNYDAGKGTKDDPFLISSGEMWESLANCVKAGNSLSGLYFLQTCDINVDVPIGTVKYPFDGIYNGGGHTIHANISQRWDEATQTASVAFTAPFLHIEGASIKNVKVDGDVAGGIHTAGLVGSVTGTGNTIENCHVSAIVTCDHSGSGDPDHGGGIVGHGGSATLTVKGCLFDGIMQTSTGDAGKCGGAILGWADNVQNITIVDCVENGTYKDFATTGVNLYHDNGVATLEGTNNYSLSGFSGLAAHSITNGTNNMELSFLNGLMKYNTTEITYYVDSDNNASGIGVNGVRYAKDGQNVQFTVDIDESMRLFSLKVNDKDYTPVDGIYTITVDGEDYVVVGNVQRPFWTDEAFRAKNFNIPKVGTYDYNKKIIVITKPEELALLAYEVNNGGEYREWNFRLANDINMSEHRWEPIGKDYDNRFTGSFNGQGHKISGVSNDDNTMGYVGLFGYNYGVICNLKLSGCTFTGQTCVGAIAAHSSQEIQNCHVDRNVVVRCSGEYAGGLVGCMKGYSNYDTGYVVSYSMMSGCASEACVVGNAKIGGLVGELYYGTLEDCVYAGDQVSRTEGNETLSIGALVGNNYYGNVIRTVYTEEGLAALCNTNDVRIYRINHPADIAITFSDRIKQFDVSGISTFVQSEAELDAVSYNGDDYAINGRNPKFFISPVEQWYDITKVEVNFGDGYVDAAPYKNESDGSYSFLMPANEVYLMADLTFNLMGDVNMDGTTTIADLMAIVSIILGEDSVEPYKYDHEAADLNKDGMISVADISILLNFILDF